MNTAKHSLKWLCLIGAVPLCAAANQPPVANNVNYFGQEDEVRYFQPLFNDSDPDGDTLEIISVSGANNASVSFTSSVITYIPKANLCTSGTNANASLDHVQYQISDGHGGTASATLNVGMLCLNDAPVAANLNYANKENETRYLYPINYASDPDTGNNSGLTINQVSTPMHASINVYDNRIQVISHPNYCTGGDPSKRDVLTYNVKDEDGAVSANAQITIDYVCQRPVGQGLFYTPVEEEARVFTPLDYASDPNESGNANLSLNFVSSPRFGSMYVQNNKIYYTPMANYCSTPGDSNTFDLMQYNIVDPQGNVSDTYNINVQIVCVNDAPVANADILYLDQFDSKVEFSATTLTSNDTDVDNTNQQLSLVDIYTKPSHGTAVIESNTLYYTPDPNYCNSDDNSYDNLSYRVTDGNAISNSANVALRVSCANRPTAVNDSYLTDSSLVVTPGVTATLNVLSNDNGGNTSGLEVTGVFLPQYGTYSNTGSVINYTAKPDYCGKDEMTYRVKDANNLESSVAQVDIMVKCTKHKKGWLQYFDGLYNVNLRSENGTWVPNESFRDLSTMTVSNNVPTRNTKAYITLTNSLGQSFRPCTYKNCGSDTAPSETYVIENGGLLVNAIKMGTESNPEYLKARLQEQKQYRVNIIMGSADDSVNGDIADSDMSYRIVDYRPSDIISTAVGSTLIVAYSYNVENCYGSGTECLMLKLGHVTLGQNNSASVNFKLYDPLNGKTFDDKSQHWHCPGQYDQYGVCQTSVNGETSKLTADSAYWNRFGANLKAGDGDTMKHPYFTGTIDKLVTDRAIEQASPQPGINPIFHQLNAKYGSNLAHFDSNQDANGAPIFTATQQGNITIPRPYRVETGQGNWSITNGQLVVSYSSNVESNGVLQLQVGDLNTSELYLNQSGSSASPNSSVFACATNNCQVTRMTGFGFVSYKQVGNFQQSLPDNRERFANCYAGNALENDIRSVKPGDNTELSHLMRLKHNFNASYTICPNTYQSGDKLTAQGVAQSYNHVKGVLVDCGDRVPYGETTTPLDFNYCYEHLGLPNTASTNLVDPSNGQPLADQVTGSTISFDYNFLPFQGAHIYDTDYNHGYQIAPNYQTFSGVLTKANGPYAVDHEEAFGGHKNAILVATDANGEVKGMVYLELSYDARFAISGIGYKKPKI